VEREEKERVTWGEYYRKYNIYAWKIAQWNPTKTVKKKGYLRMVLKDST
jgi:hypothetical protein